MALKQPWDSIYGASFKDAYHKIIDIHFDYLSGLAVFKVGIYCTEEDRDSNRPPLYVRKMSLNIADEEFTIREQVYEYLKTTNNYQEAENV